MACSKFFAARLVPLNGIGRSNESQEEILLNTPELIVGSSKEGKSLASDGRPLGSKYVVFRLLQEENQWTIERVGSKCIKLNGDCLGRQQQVAINHEDRVDFKAGGKATYVFCLEDPLHAPLRRRPSLRTPFSVVNSIGANGTGVKSIVQDHELSHAKTTLKIMEDTVSRIEREKRALERRNGAILEELQAANVAKETLESKMAAMEQDIARMQTCVTEASSARDEAATRLIDRLKSVLECCICTELVVGAVSLNCMHTFCQACIGQWRMGPNHRCPVCRTIITSAAKNHTHDNVVEVLISHGMSEEQRNHRRELIEQHAETLDANPSYRNLRTTTIVTPVAELLPAAEDGLPLSIIIMEEQQRTREVLLRLQRERILRRQEDVPWQNLDPQLVENQDVTHYEARAQYYRQFLDLYRDRIELRRSLIRRYEELLERHAELMAQESQPSERVQQLSRESVERHRERLQGHEQLMQDEHGLIAQYEEMVQHYEELVRITQRLREEEENVEALHELAPQIQQALAEPEVVETQPSTGNQTSLPDVRFRPVYSSTPLQRSESDRASAQQPTLPDGRPAVPNQGTVSNRRPGTLTNSNGSNSRAVARNPSTRIPRQPTRTAPYDMNLRELRRRPVHPPGVRPVWRY